MSLRELNPWRTIWFSPRQTVRALINADDPPSWVPPFVVFSFGSGLGAVDELWALGHRPLSLAIVRAMLLRVAFGCAFVWAAAWFLGVIGRRRGGVGTAKNLRLALGWSCVPGLPFLLAWGPIWILSGGALNAEGDVHSVGQLAAWLLYVLVSIALVWVPILMVVTVAEAHRLAVWQTIDAVVSAIVAVVILLVVLVDVIRRYF